jgi:transposase
MPWKESRILDQRLQFLSSYQKEEMSVADLCREYGISRPTGYRWINRYNETGPEGLVDLSRRPHSCSHATLEPIENAIFALRAKHPSWGARKLKARLEMLQPDVIWPAASTFGNILSRAGLTSPQKRENAPRHAQSRSLWSRVRISCGAWISKVTLSPVMASAAIPSPSRMRIADI